MTFETVWTVVKKIIDIILVWFVFYFILKSIRNNVKMTLLFKGIIALLLIKLLIVVLDGCKLIVNCKKMRCMSHILKKGPVL